MVIITTPEKAAKTYLKVDETQYKPHPYDCAGTNGVAHNMLRQAQTAGNNEAAGRIARDLCFIYLNHTIYQTLFPDTFYQSFRYTVREIDKLGLRTAMAQPIREVAMNAVQTHLHFAVQELSKSMKYRKETSPPVSEIIAFAEEFGIVGATGIRDLLAKCTQAANGNHKKRAVKPRT